MSGLGNLAKELGIPIVEDCAQAHGTLFKGRQVGTFGVLGCFSFYPTKNIGAFGDAGAIITNDEVLAGELRKLRVYGYDASGISLREGTNARISELQAAFLRVKIQVFEDWLARRRRVAEVYNSHIIASEIELPPSQKLVEPSYHQYVIRAKNRRKVMDGLKGVKISSAIHYPVPVHLMPAYRFLGGEKLDLPVTLKAASEIISLPIHEAITENEALVIARALNTIGG
jgi:dTDP-4-amino-4,6-dideoxygalactose transaminase